MHCWTSELVWTTLDRLHSDETGKLEQYRLF